MHAVMHSLSDYQHFAFIVNNSFIFFVSYGGDFIQLVSLFVQAESKKKRRFSRSASFCKREFMSFVSYFCREFIYPL